jgi:hypothetical protein
MNGDRIMSVSFDYVLAMAQQLPVNEQQELIARLSSQRITIEQIEANLAIVRETRGTIKGLDYETLISLAEDEDYCGY